MRRSRNHCPPVRNVVEGNFSAVFADAFCHSLNGNASQAGVEDRTIDHSMGHQREEMRRRHRQVLPEEKRKELDRLEY